LKLGSWPRLREAQTGPANEAEAMAAKELAATPVFRRQLRKAAESMKDAVKRMGELGKPAPAKALPDAETEKSQQLALRRLEQLASALKEEKDGARLAAGGGGGEGDGAGGGAEGDGLPPLGQLKLLRAMQSEVNERTEAFRKKHAARENLTDQEK